MSFDPKKLKFITTEPGVYLMIDREKNILYIGKAKNLRLRLKHYFLPGRDGRAMVPFLTSKIAYIETIVTFSEKEALLLENTLIKKHKPQYNILLKDDKTFISLTIDPKQTWPMIKLVRCRGQPKKEQGLCFGPYTSAFAARQTLELMNHLFKLRQCSNRELLSRTRPCLLYAINRCLAPCAQKCQKDHYKEEVIKAIDFLKGNNGLVVKELKKQLKKASEALEFEKAASLLHTLKNVQQVIGFKQSVIRSKGKDCDALALYSEGKSHLIVQLLFREGRLTGSRSYPFKELASNHEEIWETFLLQHYSFQNCAPREILLPLTLTRKPLIEELLSKTHPVDLLFPQKGEKKKLLMLAKKNAEILFQQEKEIAGGQESLLLDLQEQCSLNHPPIRIECFDTSNISGTDLVACMVGFINGKREKKQTKLFKVKGVTKPDDYGALKEVLKRHYEKSLQEDFLPDLLIIDGGKGQLNCAQSVFKDLGIVSVDILSLAKEQGRHDKGLNREKIFIPYKKDPITLSPRSSTLFLLQKIRDEAHRVAITFHRKRRSKRLLSSSLDDIPGIGPKKRIALLKHFGSVKSIQKASKKELKALSILSKKDVESLMRFGKVKRPES